MRKWKGKKLEGQRVERIEVNYRNCPSRLACSELIIGHYLHCEFVADPAPETDVLFVVDRDWAEWCDEWPFFSFAPMYLEQRGTQN